MKKLFFLIILVLMISSVFAYSEKQTNTMDSFILFADKIDLPKDLYPQEVLNYIEIKEQQSLEKQNILRNYLLHGGN